MTWAVGNDPVDQAVDAVRMAGAQQIVPAPPASYQAGASDVGMGFPPEVLKAIAMQGAMADAPRGIRHNMVASSRRYFFAHNGIWEDGTPHLDYRILRAVGYRNPVLWLILNTLIGQVADHFVRPPNERAIGVRVVQKDRHRPLTPGAAKKIKYIESVLFRGGVIREHPKTGEQAAWDLEFQYQGDPLGTAVRKLIRDSLVLDQVYVSVEGSPKLGGKAKNPVLYWKVEDGALARKVDSEKYVPMWRPNLKGQVKHVLVDPTVGRWSVMREYRWDEGYMFHRNPRTEWGSFGYGKSEVEQALDVILGVLYGMNANKEWFTDNHIPNGILSLVGQFGPNEVQQLRLRLKQEVGGLGRYFGMPIIASPPGAGTGVNYVPFNPKQDFGMVSEQWITFCVAVGAGIFQISPEEFGFASFGGPDSTLQQPDPESTFKQSQHKGLIPKVRWTAEALDQAVVQPIDEDFTLHVQGIEASYIAEDTARSQLDQGRLVNGWTINDVQAANDLPPKFDALDEELWQKLTDEYEDRWYENQVIRQKEMMKEYKKRGGRVGKCYDAPVSNAGAMEIWMAEHMAENEGAKEQMNQMGMDEAQHQRNQEAAEQQAAHEGMSQMAGASDERQAAQEAEDATDKSQGMMRVPGVDDASQLRKSIRRKIIKIGRLCIRV